MRNALQGRGTPRTRLGTPRSGADLPLPLEALSSPSWNAKLDSPSQDKASSQAPSSGPLPELRLLPGQSSTSTRTLDEGLQGSTASSTQRLSSTLQSPGTRDGGLGNQTEHLIAPHDTDQSRVRPRLTRSRSRTIGFSKTTSDPNANSLKSSLFGAWDIDGSKTLSRHELWELLWCLRSGERRGRAEVPAVALAGKISLEQINKEVDQVFNLFDVDDDGLLDWSEFERYFEGEGPKTMLIHSIVQQYSHDREVNKTQLRDLEMDLSNLELDELETRALQAGVEQKIVSQALDHPISLRNYIEGLELEQVLCIRDDVLRFLKQAEAEAKEERPTCWEAMKRRCKPFRWLRLWINHWCSPCRKMCCKHKQIGGRIPDRLYHVGLNQDPSSPLFAQHYDKALDDALDKWAAQLLNSSLAVAKTDFERNAMHKALGKGRFGLRLDQIMKKCKKLGVMSSMHLVCEEDEDRMEELERYSSDERMHEPTADETERHKKDAFRLLKMHVEGELRQDDVAAEKALNALMKKQVDAKNRGIDIREGGCVSVITTFVGTVFPALFTDGERWYHWFMNSAQIFVSIFVYWATRFFIIGWGYETQRYDNEDLPKIKNVGVLGSFLSFFLVFFASQSYSRFNAQYGSSLASCGRIFDICTMAQASLSAGEAHRLWRHLNASHILAYIGLTTTERYSVSSLLKPLQRDHRLLTDTEWQMFVVASANDEGLLTGACPYRDLIAWAVQDIELACKPRQNIEFWQPKDVEEWIRSGEELNAIMSNVKASERNKIAACFRKHQVDGHHLMRVGSTGQKMVLGAMEHIIAEARRPVADDGSPETVDMLLLRMFHRSQETNAPFSTDEIEGYRSVLEDAGLTGVQGAELLANLARDPSILRKVVTDMYDKKVPTSGTGGAIADVGRREKLVAGLVYCLNWRHERRANKDEQTSSELACEIRAGVGVLVWGPRGQLSETRSKEMISQLLRLRGSLGSLYGFKNNPVPFFYVHLLYLIGGVYLPMFAFDNALQWPDSGSYYIEMPATAAMGNATAAMAGEQQYVLQRDMWLMTSLVGWAVILLQNIIVLGLTKVCEMLADPFGTDIADLTVTAFITNALNASKKIVKLSSDHHHLRLAGEPYKQKRLERHEKDLEIQGTFGLLEKVMKNATRENDDEWVPRGIRQRVEKTLGFKPTSDQHEDKGGRRRHDQRKPTTNFSRASSQEQIGRGDSNATRSVNYKLQ